MIKVIIFFKKKIEKSFFLFVKMKTFFFSGLEYETLNTPINMLAQDPCLKQSIITNTFTTTLGNDDFNIDYKLDCKQKLATFTLTTNTYDE